MSESPDRFMAWEAQSGVCGECGFDWEQRNIETLVEQCGRDIAAFEDALEAVDPLVPVAEGLWSANSYVWHSVDVLRFGAERFWTLSLDPGCGVPAWDEGKVADSRSYDQLSPLVAVVAIGDAFATWRTAALGAPRNVATSHPEARAIDTFDLVQRNAHEIKHHLYDVQRSAHTS